METNIAEAEMDWGEIIITHDGGKLLLSMSENYRF